MDIQNAERSAEKIFNDKEKAIQNKKNKAIADLTAKLDQQFKQYEKNAKDEAKKIKSDGELEADKLKQDLQRRIPDAVKRIVNSVISGK